MGRNQKRFTPIVIALLITAVVLIACGTWYYEAHHAKSPIAPQSATIQMTTTTSTPSLAIIYEADHFYGQDPFNSAQFVLYNITTGTSTILKSFDASFQKLTTPWTWTTPNHAPIVLSTINNNTSSTSQVEFFDPQKNDVRDVALSRSPIISPEASIAISPLAEEVAYCDSDGQFALLNAESGEQTIFGNAQACYAEEEAQPPQFSSDGMFIYYATVPSTENGYKVGSSSISWKLDLASGVVTSTSFLAYPGTYERTNPDQTEYIDAEYAGFSIRQIVGSVENPAYSQDPGMIESLKILHDVTLPETAAIGNAIFTMDGKGVFYYTETLGAVNSTNGTTQNIQLGYYDIPNEKNYYPLPLPQQPIVDINLLGATDKSHLVYQATAELFGGGSMAGHIIQSEGSSSLYIQGASTSPAFIDTSVAGFSLKSFLISE